MTWCCAAEILALYTRPAIGRSGSEETIWITETVPHSDSKVIAGEDSTELYCSHGIGCCYPTKFVWKTIYRL